MNGFPTFRAAALALLLSGSTISASCSSSGNTLALNFCPRLTSWDVSPLQVSVGSTVDVAATVDDRSSPSDLLTFAWTPAPSFTVPTAAKTQYHCTAPGMHTITVTVSDNHGDDPCTTAVSMDVSCAGQ